MIITAHQPNFLPGLSVTTKLGGADAVLWLDDVEYTKNGWTNRNQLPDGTYLTVPVRRQGATTKIADVKIAESAKGERWRDKMAQTIRERYARHDFYVDEFAKVIEANGSDSLLALNTQLLGLVLQRGLPRVPASYSQRALDETAPIDTANISEWLAERCRYVADDLDAYPGEPLTYLSGPSGRDYLDLQHFIDREVQVAFYTWPGEENPCCIDQLFKTGRVA